MYLNTHSTSHYSLLNNVSSFLDSRAIAQLPLGVRSPFFCTTLRAFLIADRTLGTLNRKQA
ncbi:hypothetical protein QUA20_29135 [Microcoleus sp. Pol7_A1]|uniref:hypothetical protein n=1 Tax=unclassified Microcoleus TaxID=2642155 RepID=UPI002FD1222F